ncbi:hypothetical protein [Hyalangium versicolor]|uniref:hypothetical protein n=1 Tax=Hyalangium versicolor TaxID=2861190 RepID=UPI001CCBC94C|nr:hypothetical protein [Hyalangium versicolor]
MQAISDALNRLLEDGAWFVRAHEFQLLVVRVGGELRKTALQILSGLEFLPDNKSAFLVLEDAHSAADDGWLVRAERVRANWEDRRKAFLEREGLEVPSAAPAASRPKGERGTASLVAFSEAAVSVQRVMPPPMNGQVFVLAPTIIESPQAFGAELEALMKVPSLAACRWVWVLEASVPWPKLADPSNPRCLRSECIPDLQQQSKDLKAMVSAPPAQFGRAGPRGVKPPPRVTDPPPIDPAIRDRKLREAGMDPAYLEQAPELRSLILGAAIAMKEGKGAEAVRMQRSAQNLALELKLTQVAVICQIALASYLSGLDQRPAAVKELTAAIELAARHELGMQEAQARLALALLHALDRRFPEAAREYGACARCAEAAGVPLLAIEAWRLAGQLALSLKAEQQAVAAFREAIRVAEGTERSAVENSSAPEAARKLASLCVERGLRSQADSLFEQADAMERGEVGLVSTPGEA